MNTVANEKSVTQEQVRPQGYVVPEVNIYETKDGFILEAEMPGVNKDGLEVTVEENELTIVGRRAKDELKAVPLFRETSNLDYRRAFELAPEIDTAKVEAKLEQGVLTVRLPKSERVKPRKITVTG